MELFDRLAAIPGYAKPPKHDGLSLDSNENLVIAQPTPEMDTRKYPGDHAELISKIASYIRAKPETIGLGNGSDQILDMMLVLGGRMSILTTDPTFAFFESRCRLYRHKMTKVPFSDKMQPDTEALLEMAPSYDMVYLDSPNNPTGYQFSRKLLGKMADTSKFLLVDEAYVEFGGPSAVPLVKKHPNIMVTRTFSKAFGLAALRLGYFVTNGRTAGIFNNIIQYPYPVNSVALKAGLHALGNQSAMKVSVDTVRSERGRIISSLQKYDVFRVFPSSANFVLFAVDGADRIHTALLEQGISIRNLGMVGGHRGCLRVTVGTPEMNSKFLLAVRDLLM